MKDHSDKFLPIGAGPPCGLGVAKTLKEAGISGSQAEPSAKSAATGRNCGRNLPQSPTFRKKPLSILIPICRFIGFSTKKCSLFSRFRIEITENVKFCQPIQTKLRRNTSKICCGTMLAITKAASFPEMPPKDERKEVI